MFYDCVVISDLYLFQEIVLLNLFYIFLKFDLIIYRQSNNWYIKFRLNLFEILLQLFVLLPLDYLPSLQELLIFQILCILFTMTDQAQFHSQSVANEKISKNYSNILMEEELLCLMYHCHLVCSQWILSYIQKIYLLLLFCCYSSYY